MATKPTTVEDSTRKPNGSVVNSQELVFPQDEHGFTSMLRKEGVRAVGRIGGDPERLNVFKATLRVLAQHADTKLKHQQTERQMDLDTAQKIVDSERERALADQQGEIARLTRDRDALDATLAAKVAEATGAE